MTISLVTVRLYTATDNYSTDTDNRPLTDLVTNQNAIAAAVEGQTLSGLADQSITSPNPGERLVYDSANSKWVNSPDMANSDGFIDGNFDFWSLGTSTSVAAGTTSYVSDVWRVNCGTGGTLTASQDVRVLGSQPTYMTAPSMYRLRLNQTVAGTATGYFSQRIRGATKYAGQTVTLQASLWSAASGNFVTGVNFIQHFGTGGTPSADVTTTVPVTWTTNTTEALFGATVAVPSVSGKTLGTNGDDYIEIQFVTASSVYDLRISQVQISHTRSDLTAGVILPFLFRGRVLEQIRVQRYYETGEFQMLFTGTTGNVASQFVKFNVTPTVAPAMSYSVTSNTGLSVTSITATPNRTGALIAISVGTGSANNAILGTWIKDARP